MTEQQRQEKINEAAEKFADALRESYQTVAGRAVSAQELNVEMTHTFFNSVIENLRAQEGQGREMAQQLADQHERQREAAQTLTQESVGAYMEFINSLFSFYQSGIETLKRS